MTLLIGTQDGIYARVDGEIDEVASGFDARRIVAGPGGRGFYAATDAGVIATRSPTSEWTDPRGPTDVWTVTPTPTGDCLAGTHDPADLYRSTDGGETWERNDRFARLPGHDEWDNLAASSTGRVRALATHRDAPHRIVAGVEAEGVYVSEDDGRSWERRVRGLNHDVHHLCVLGPGEYVAACGRGLYRTDDAGRTWTALDTHRDCFWYTYYRATLAHDGRLYACGQDRSMARFEDAAESRILVSTDGGRTCELERFPGCDADLVNAWAVHDGRPVGGTVHGRLVERRNGDWVTVGETPPVRSLCSADRGDR